MNWTLDQLRVFVAAAKVGSFSGAARKLGKVQSRVSTAIADLEIDLGFSLFDRSAKLPVLTPEGRQLLHEAELILAHCEKMQASAMRISTGEETEFVIACDESVPLGALRQLFERLARQFPALKLTAMNGSRDDISDAVREQRADIGVMFRVEQDLSDEINFKHIGQFRRTLICGLEHPLARMSQPDLSQLMSYRQLVICDKSGKGREKPLSVDHWYIDSYYHICEMAISGLGWALVPEHVANFEWYADQLKPLTCEELPIAIDVDIGVVTRRGVGFGPVGQWVLTKLGESFK